MPRLYTLGNSIKNCIECIEKSTIGFKVNRSVNESDILYICVKLDLTSLYCVARCKVGHVTDRLPEWDNASAYKFRYTIRDIQYCKPFILSESLKGINASWGGKYARSCNLIDDLNVVEKLELDFKKNASPEITSLQIDKSLIEADSNNKKQEEEIEDAEDEPIVIESTFETLSFSNETGKKRGLQKLANDNFHNLFRHFPVESTIMIKEKDKSFSTLANDEIKSKINAGVTAKPDSIIIRFNEDTKSLEINILEYECYGEINNSSSSKSRKFNTHILPQLIKFATPFSLTTSLDMRVKNIDTWIQFICNYVFENKDCSLVEKCKSWVREKEGNVPEVRIESKFKEMLKNAFTSNIKIILVIDELSKEQNEVLKNIIEAFKLESGDSFKFKSYVIKLQERLNKTNNNTNYALSIECYD